MKFSIASRHVIGRVILGVLVWLLVVGISSTGLLESTELQGYDLLVSARGFQLTPSELIIVNFDNPTVKTVGTFPISRGLLADVLQKIASGEPEFIGLDWLLSEKCTPVEDQKLAAAIASAGNVILVNNFGSEQLPPNDPLPEFRKNALDTAFVNVPVDEDRLIRRMFLWMRTQAIPWRRWS